MDDQIETAAADWYSNDAATFGDRVAAAREAMGLSQADLAKKMGIGLKTVTKWENDVAEPRANKLQMLSGVLNVSIVWLLSGKGDGVGPPSDVAAMDADITALLTEIRQIRSSLTHTADRLAVAEKKLRKAIKETL